MSIDLYPERSSFSPDAVLGLLGGGSAPSGINSTTYVAFGPTLQVYVPQGHMIRVSAKFRMVPGATADVYRALIREDGNTVGDYSHAFPIAGWGQNFPPFSAILTPTPGMHTYTLAVNRETGSGSGAIQGVDYLVVEDISGSSGSAGPINLGYGVQTGVVNGFSSAEVDVPGCTAPVQVSAGRRLKITGRAFLGGPSVANDEWVLWISEDGVHRQHAVRRNPNIGDAMDFHAEWVANPSPGSHTYKLSFQRSVGTGTANMALASDRTGFITVEDISGSAAPPDTYYEALWTPVGTLLNSWVNFDASLYTAASYRKIFDMVKLRGLIKNGTVPSTIFTLPVGYRPQKIHHLRSVGNDALATVRIQPTGAVEATLGSNTWFSLDGLEFGVG